MTDTTEALESQYVNADMVNSSESKTLVVTGEGTYEDTKFGRKLTLPVEIDSKQKMWNPNKDSIANLNSAFGTKDTKEWVGKPIDLKVVRVMGNDTVAATAKAQEGDATPATA